MPNGSGGATLSDVGRDARRWPLLVAVVLVGLNLRPFLTAVGPLAGGIRTDTGMTLQVLASLTLVPMLLMGVLAFLGPAVEAAVGARRAVVASLALLALGSLFRLVAGSAAGLIGTAALLGLGVAVIQAVFPGILKRHFPDRLPLAMGLYSAMLMGGGAVGAQLSPLIASAAGSWRAGLGWLGLPALAALVAALVAIPRGEAPVRGEVPPVGLLLLRPRTWLLMASFGLVNGGYSTVVAWLSPFYQEHGWTAAASGRLLAAMAASQAVAALLCPLLARRHRDRRPWLWLTMALQAGGFAGLAAAPAAAPLLWACCAGVGLGGCFALTLVVALDHLPRPADAGALAALMQGGGFLIAGAAPWVVAVLHDRTGGFAAGWLLHLAEIGLVAGLTLRLRPDSYRAVMAPSPDPARPRPASVELSSPSALRP